MRKTRLVILPGARCLHQLGFLLLFLACPTIAVKGQENRDVQPYCRLLTLHENWLSNNTSEWIGCEDNSEDITGLWNLGNENGIFCSNNNTIEIKEIPNCQNKAFYSFQKAENKPNSFKIKIFQNLETRQRKNIRFQLNSDRRSKYNGRRESLNKIDSRIRMMADGTSPRMEHRKLEKKKDSIRERALLGSFIRKLSFRRNPKMVILNRIDFNSNQNHLESRILFSERRQTPFNLKRQRLTSERRTVKKDFSTDTTSQLNQANHAKLDQARKELLREERGESHIRREFKRSSRVLRKSNDLTSRMENSRVKKSRTKDNLSRNLKIMDDNSFRKNFERRNYQFLLLNKRFDSMRLLNERRNIQYNRIEIRSVTEAFQYHRFKKLNSPNIQDISANRDSSNQIDNGINYNVNFRSFREMRDSKYQMRNNRMSTMSIRMITERQSSQYIRANRKTDFTNVNLSERRNSLIQRFNSRTDFVNRRSTTEGRDSLYGRANMINTADIKFTYERRVPQDQITENRLASINVRSNNEKLTFRNSQLKRSLQQNIVISEDRRTIGRNRPAAELIFRNTRNFEVRERSSEKVIRSVEFRRYLPRVFTKKILNKNSEVRDKLSLFERDNSFFLERRNAHEDQGILARRKSSPQSNRNIAESRKLIRDNHSNFAAQRSLVRDNHKLAEIKSLARDTRSLQRTDADILHSRYLLSGNAGRRRISEREYSFARTMRRNFKEFDNSLQMFHGSNLHQRRIVYNENSLTRKIRRNSEEKNIITRDILLAHSLRITSLNRRSLPPKDSLKRSLFRNVNERTSSRRISITHATRNSGDRQISLHITQRNIEEIFLRRQNNLLPSPLVKRTINSRSLEREDFNENRKLMNRQMLARTVIRRRNSETVRELFRENSSVQSLGRNMKNIGERKNLIRDSPSKKLSSKNSFDEKISTRDILGRHFNGFDGRRILMTRKTVISSSKIMSRKEREAVITSVKRVSEKRSFKTASLTRNLESKRIYESITHIPFLKSQERSSDSRKIYLKYSSGANEFVTSYRVSPFDRRFDNTVFTLRTEPKEFSLFEHVVKNINLLGATLYENFEYLRKVGNLSYVNFIGNYMMNGGEVISEISEDNVKHLWNNKRSTDKHNIQEAIAGGILCATLFLSVNKKEGY